MHRMEQRLDHLQSKVRNVSSLMQHKGEEANSEDRQKIRRVKETGWSQCCTVAAAFIVPLRPESEVIGREHDKTKFKRRLRRLATTRGVRYYAGRGAGVHHGAGPGTERSATGKSSGGRLGSTCIISSV